MYLMISGNKHTVSRRIVKPNKNPQRWERMVTN